MRCVVPVTCTGYKLQKATFSPSPYWGCNVMLTRQYLMMSLWLYSSLWHTVAKSYCSIVPSSSWSVHCTWTICSSPDPGVQTRWRLTSRWLSALNCSTTIASSSLVVLSLLMQHVLHYAQSGPWHCTMYLTEVLEFGGAGRQVGGEGAIGLVVEKGSIVEFPLVRASCSGSMWWLQWSLFWTRLLYDIVQSHSPLSADLPYQLEHMLTFMANHCQERFKIPPSIPHQDFR